MQLRLRAESTTDAPAIEALITAAFLTAPHTSHTEQFVVNALRLSGQLSISLVAELDGALVGYVAVSPVSISDGAQCWFGLGPIAVAPGQQGRGVGARLMCETLQLLRQQGAAGCVLLGDPAYYQRFGFRPEPGLVLAGVAPEHFQALAFATSLPNGEVRYHAAFTAQA